MLDRGKWPESIRPNTPRAEVVDIRSDTPTAADTFLVDTNVWFWLTYTRASLANRPPRLYQATDYPAYMNSALNVQSKLYWCGLSLPELAHSIEKTEREVFARTPGFDNTTNKQFRHNYPIERTKVVAEVQTAWTQVKNIASPIGVAVDEANTDAALGRFQTDPVDGYDLFILEAISKAGIVQVITDDGDFSTIPAIRVFTSNRNVITTATRKGKILCR